MLFDVMYSFFVWLRAGSNTADINRYWNHTGNVFTNVFDAYCLGFSVSGAVDDAVKASAVIEITGAVTYTQSTVIPQL